MSTISNKELKHSVNMFRKYKNLLKELTAKTVKLKYRDSWLGILWSFFQPLLSMVVLAVVFGAIFGRKLEGTICYPVYLFTGRLLFSFFTSSTKQAMTSFRKNQAIIKKVYVPKYMYPLSAIFGNFVTFAISILCLIGVWIFFKLTGLNGGSNLQITWHIILSWIPLLILLLFGTGVGMILAVVCVYFRDVEYIWDVLTQLLFYMIPILYTLKQINTPWMVFIIRVNPLYSIIEMFRSCVLYGELMNINHFIYATGFAVVTLAIGLLFFNKKSDDLIYHL